ncbi:hypothetical protein LINPERPRIM_LOCUS36441 [Linum perenne]
MASFHSNKLSSFFHAHKGTYLSRPMSFRLPILCLISCFIVVVSNCLINRWSGALFSTSIVGDKPILVRDFIHSALYDPDHGYFSQRSRSVGVLEKSIKFERLQGREAYVKHLDKVYKQSDVSWFTPVELFKPWYAYGIAEAIMRSANFSVPLKIYEIGGGSGTCAKGIMDYIMLHAPPRVYNNMTYT